MSLDLRALNDMCPKRAGHRTESYEKGRKKGKTSSFCRAFTLEFHVVISTGSMSQICCVVDSIGSTHSARKGFGYLRKKLAEEAKQAIRAAVSWTDAIGALRRDEGRHWTNFHMSNRFWIAFCKQYFLYFKIIQMIKWPRRLYSFTKPPPL